MRLLSACGGPPIRALGSGGRVAQLARLKSGLHPVTRVRLGETTKLDGTKVERSKGYLRLDGDESRAIDPDFQPYQPVAFPPSICSALVDGDGETAKQKAALRRCRVKLKVKRTMVSLRGAELKELLESFIDGGADHAVEGGADSDEEFWSTLDDRDWNTPLSLHPVDVHCGEPVHYSGHGRQSGIRVSRASRLGALRG